MPSNRPASPLGYAALALLTALGVGALLARIVSRNVARLRRELLQVARFDLAERANLRSSIRELDDMGRATMVMKQGLRAFSRYVPHQLVRQVLASGRDAELGAERRELSVLFSDIEGFTTVVERTPTDQVLGALGAYLASMNHCIQAERGTVGQYLGDGIMAFWGAPEEVEDHAVAACRGALAMLDRAKAMIETSTERGEPAFVTRIGIDTGDVMVGNIGAPDRFNYGILGDSVNMASRFEQLNKAYRTSIIAGPRTVALAKHAILFRPLDRVLLRGKTRPTLVYELVGIRDEVDDDTLSFVAGYTSALELYFEARFAEARSAFEASLERRPNDVASEQMAARCRAYEEAPPGKDWSGVHQA